MGKNDPTNIFHLALGAVAGIIIYTAYNDVTTARAYETNDEGDTMFSGNLTRIARNFKLGNKQGKPVPFTDRPPLETADVVKYPHAVNATVSRLPALNDYNKPYTVPGNELVPWGYSSYARAYFSEGKMAYAAKKKKSSSGSSKTAPAADTSASKPAGGGGGGGGATAASGKLPYPSTGKTWTMKDSGATTRHYASGGSSGTTEYDVDVGGVANLMGVVYYTHPASCGGGHGDEADIKLWGPHHSDGGCCWCIVNIAGNGDVCTGGEGPHPKTTKCKTKVGNVGPVAGKRIGLAHAIWQSGKGAHSEVWIDTGGGFKKIGQYEGVCGNAKTSTSPSSGQQVQFRCDCSGVKIESTNVYEIAAGGGGGGSAPAPKGAGAVVPALRPGVTPIPTIPPITPIPTKPPVAAAAFVEHNYTVTVA